MKLLQEVLGSWAAFLNKPQPPCNGLSCKVWILARLYYQPIKLLSRITFLLWTQLHSIYKNEVVFKGRGRTLSGSQGGTEREQCHSPRSYGELWWCFWLPRWLKAMRDQVRFVKLFTHWRILPTKMLMSPFPSEKYQQMSSNFFFLALVVLNRQHWSLFCLFLEVHKIPLSPFQREFSNSECQSMNFLSFLFQTSLKLCQDSSGFYL